MIERADEGQEPGCVQNPFTADEDRSATLTAWLHTHSGAEPQGLSVWEESDFQARFGRPVRTLGRGGMGQVSLHIEPVLERRLAVKVALAGAHEPSFVREARIQANLEVGVLAVHALGRRAEDGRLFCVMDVADGQDLADLLAVGVRLERGVALLSQACRIVARAHRRGLVHRDLKPTNLRVQTDGQVVVLDWGLADAVGCSAARAGTVGWSAPEQLVHDHIVRPSADVAALGRILQAVGGHADPVLAAVAARACALDPDQRFGDAAALADELDRWLEHRLTRTYPYSVIQRLVLLVRRRPLGALSGGLAVVAAGLALFAGWRWVDQAAIENDRRKARAATVQQSMVLDAALAAAEGRWGASAVLAAEALRLGPNEHARSLFDQARAVWLPPVIAIQSADCDDLVLGQGLFCGGVDALSGWPEGGEPWRIPMPHPVMDMVIVGDHLAVSTGAQDLLVVDASTGALVQRLSVAQPERVFDAELRVGPSGLLYHCFNGHGVFQVDTSDWTVRPFVETSSFMAGASSSSGLVVLQDQGLVEVLGHEGAARWSTDSSASLSAVAVDLVVLAGHPGGLGAELRALRDGQEVWRSTPYLANLTGLSFSPDGALLAVRYSTDRVVLLDAMTGSQVGAFMTAFQSGDRVLDLAWEGDQLGVLTTSGWVVTFDIDGLRGGLVHGIASDPNAALQVLREQYGLAHRDGQVFMEAW